MELPHVDVEIVSYSPVAGRRGDDAYWREVLHGEDLDEVLRRRCAKYVLRCHQAEETDFHEIQFRTPEGEWLYGKLQRLLDLPVGSGDAERCDITQELASNLSDRMTASGGAAVPGAIFLIQARIQDKRHIALVKLDLGRTEIVALQQSGSRRLVSRIIEGALPEDARAFRKAVLVPSPGEGDARSGQFDAHADYWQDFVGARPLREAVKATRAILKTVREVMQQEGKTPTEGMVSRLLRGVQQLRTRTTGAVAGLIRDVTEIQKKPANIEQALSRNLGRSTLAAVTGVSTYVYRLLDGKLKISVPADIVNAGTVRIQRKDNDVTILIRNTDIDRDDIVEHRP